MNTQAEKLLQIVTKLLQIATWLKYHRVAIGQPYFLIKALPLR